MELTVNSYPQIAKIISDAADKFCDGKLCVLLGGGYDDKVSAHAFYLITGIVSGMKFEELEVESIYTAPKEDPEIEEMVDRIIEQVKETHSEYWKSLR